jgi:hypothetical protein
MDNLRSIKELARNNAENAEDAILVSLDAKKAFDSVSHKYIRKALEKYGFGANFIKVFTTLYTDLKARVLVNGWQSEMFEILKGVKQGDALSCILFIICIDPLIRNIIKNPEIKSVIAKKNLGSMDTKAFGYADDVSALIKDDNKSVQELFSEYGKLTRLSNLTLNADKTEIVHFKKLPTRSRINRSGFPILHPALRDHIQRALRAHSNSMFPHGNTHNETNNINADIPSENDSNYRMYKFTYENVEYNLAPVKSLKICGITFSADPHLAYDRNIRDKIHKLKKQLDRWKPRNLSILGKILIIKTFGLSQLIYSLQCCEIEQSELKEIEYIILAYIWKMKEGKRRFTERIKRENIYKTRLAGGFAALNPFSLDKALKIRTVLRATNANHPIKFIQGKNIGPLMPVYNTDELMCAKTKQYLTEIAASQLARNENGKEEWLNNINLLELYKLVDVKGISMLYAKKCNEHGLITLRDTLIAAQAENHVMHMKAKLATKWIEEKLVFIPNKVNLFARCEEQIIWITGGSNNLKVTKDTPSRELRQAIDSLLHNSCKIYDPSTKYQDISFNLDRLKISYGNISKITSIRTRNANLRAIHGDIYTYERMRRYNMVDTDLCPRCGEVETKEHLIIKCQHSKNIWQHVMDLINKVHKQKIELDLQSVLNLNHLSDSKPITNIIAHFLHNIMYFRPTNMTQSEVEKRIYDLVTFEIKGKKTKPKKSCPWQKWEQFFLTRNTGRTS